jgi:hypothetical protein
MKEIECAGTISGVISCLKEHFNPSVHLWFRGQPIYKYELTPSLFRTCAGRCRFNEANMYYEFQRRHHEHSSTHRSVVEWLTLMQHYGLPTRLLDWSTNLLVALYFCCNADAEADAALFAFDPEILRDFSFNPLLEMQTLSRSTSDFYRNLIYHNAGILDDEALINGISIRQIKSDPILQFKFTHATKAIETPLESLQIRTELQNTVDATGRPVPFVYSEIIRVLSNVVPVVVPPLNARLRQQCGRFTLHGGAAYDGRDFIRFERMEAHPYLVNSLVKLRIKSGDKSVIREELRLCGVNEPTLFPEMEYQAKEIKQRYVR